MTEQPKIPEDNTLGEWLRPGGPDSEVALCTRVRLARNLQGHRFSTNQNQRDAEELLEILTVEVPDLLRDRVRGVRVLDLTGLDPYEREVLVERHLVSRELALHPRPAAAVVDSDESLSIMLNEEDHLRSQVFRSGFAIEEAFSEAESIDDLMVEAMPLAFSEEFGFLTSCPTNLGTGLRVSVLVHLPAMVWAGEIEKMMNAAQNTNLAVRGLYGEGSRGVGDFYQISNQVTLGKSEDQLREDVSEAVTGVIKWERDTRQTLLEGKTQRRKTDDRIEEAEKSLRRARALDSGTCLDAMSALRLALVSGVDLASEYGLDLDLERLNRLLLYTQPAHLQHLVGRALSPEERDELRAEVVQRTIWGD
ncbi:MAG: ATP--guanido phosphotransferase [Planctomycetota bacterium]